MRVCELGCSARGRGYFFQKDEGGRRVPIFSNRSVCASTRLGSVAVYPVIRISECLTDVFLVEMVKCLIPCLCKDGTGEVTGAKSIRKSFSESIVCAVLISVLGVLLDKPDDNIAPCKPSSKQNDGILDLVG